MLTPTDSLAAALAVISGPVFVQLDATVLRACHPVKVRTAPQTKNHIVPAFFTWRPKKTHVFTLIKTIADTVVYCHDNDTAYYANPCAKLGTAVPAGVAMLAHWCIDDLRDDTKTPHLLVFDIMDQGAADPATRGERLRMLSGALPQPLCVVQWAGNIEALNKFIPTLPHEVECTVALTEDPLIVHVPKAAMNTGQALSAILGELNKQE